MDSVHTEDVKQALSETIPVENLDHFVQILNSWHERQVKTAKHFLQVPLGQEVEVGDAQFVLDSANHKGFLLGINLILALFVELPFVAEAENSDDQALNRD